MKLIARIIRALTGPFKRSAHRPESDCGDLSSNPVSAGDRLAYTRTRAASIWRILIRVSIITAALCLFVAAEWGVAFLIENGMWWMLAASFILIGIVLFSLVRPTHMFIVWLTTSPLVYYFFSGDLGPGLPKVTFDRVALPLIAVAALIRVAGRRGRLRKPVLGELLLLGFVIYAGLNISLFHPFKMESFNPYIEFVLLAGLAYFVTKVALVEKKHVEWAVIGLTVLGFLNGAVLTIETQTGCVWYSWIFGQKIPLQWEDIGQGRGQGLFTMPHVTQIYCSMMVFMAIHLMKSARSSAAKLFYAICTVVQVIAIYLAYSRSGYIAFAIVIMLMPFFVLASRKTYIKLTVLAVVLVAVLMPFFLGNRDFVSRMTSDTATIRFKINDSNINLIKHNLWLGVGYSRVQEAFDKYVTSIKHRLGVEVNPMALKRPNKPHNWHLQVLGEEGLVGGFFYYGSILAFLAYMMRLRHRLPRNGTLSTNCITVILVGTIANLLALNLFGGPKTPYPIYVFWIVFAIAVRLGELTGDESKAAAEESDSSAERQARNRQMARV